MLKGTEKKPKPPKVPIVLKPPEEARDGPKSGEPIPSPLYIPPAPGNGEPPPLICPHCRQEVTSVEWRFFGNKERKMALIGCSKCRFVLAGNLLPN